MTYTSVRSLVWVAIGAAMMCGLAAGSVHAAAPHRGANLSVTGSLVYAKGGNLWVARPDGSHQHQVTHDGKTSSPYEYPTQADNGTIEAQRSWKLYRMDRNGRLLNKRFKFVTGPHSKISLHTMSFSPAISPNGRIVAFTLLTYQGLVDPTTGASGANILAENIQYRDAKTGAKLNERHLAGTYLQSPSWIDNNRLLVFAPYNSFAPQVYTDTLSRGLANWFGDGSQDQVYLDRQVIDQGELTRKGDKLVLIRGTNLKNNWRGAAVQIYAVHGLGTAPTPACSLSAQHGMLNKPTWSPDGTTLAWSDSNGIWESAVDLSSQNCGLTPRLVISGGSSPDWGPTGVSR